MWIRALKENSEPGERSKKVWSERGYTTPHGFPRQILSLVRLPIPPLSQAMKWIGEEDSTAGRTFRNNERVLAGHACQHFTRVTPAQQLSRPGRVCFGRA